MAHITTTKTRVNNSSITGQGNRGKRVVNAILSMCSDISIHSVISDTEDEYSVYLSWKGITDWVISVSTSSAYINIDYMLKNADGSYDSLNSYSTPLNGDVYVEASMNGSVMLFVSISNSSTTAGIVFTCMQVKDQFTSETKNIASLSSTVNQYYALGKFMLVEGDTVSECKFTKNANGLTPNGLTAAIPAVFYTDSAVAPLSGFADELYFVYQGASQVPFEARLTKFSIDGQSFVSLGQYLCIKTS